VSGKLFIHIGLPKTATSSLQTDFFPKIETDLVEYIGVDGLRREEKLTDLYKRIVRAVNTGDGIQGLRVDLASQLNHRDGLIISEEMFTVSEGVMTWPKKLANLGRLVSGLDYVLILTVREPAAGLFSYYAELYPRFCGRYADFIDCAMHDPDMHIFHYKKLFDQLIKNFELQRIKAFKFEEIISGNLTSLIDLILPGQTRKINVVLGEHNSRKKSSSILKTNHRLTIAYLLRRLAENLGVFNAIWFERLKVVFRPVVRMLEMVSFYNLKLKVPQPKEMDRLREYLKQETAALKMYLGVDYE
jgi:hypothetical protein